MQSQFLKHPVLSCLVGAGLLVSNPVAADHRVYLDDADTTASPPAQSPSLPNKFPRVGVHEMDKGMSNDAYRKYQIIYGHGNVMKRVADIQAVSSDVMFVRHISGRAYQSYNQNFCTISSGIAFESSGPTTQGGPSGDGCSIYAGHWLYKPGSTLTQSINATTTTLKVAAASKFTVGQYVVIYDAPAGSFKNAEHAKVSGRNLSTNTLTLQSRGYKSSAKSHPSGAIVAQHVLGQGGDPRLWAFNMSNKSPKDGNGRTFAQAYAVWLKKNLSRYKGGTDPGANVSGIIFDADFYYDFKGTDADNNLVLDNGVSNSGVNWLGDGLDAFYADLRNKFPNKFILAGTPNSRGYPSLQGTQMESFPDHGNGDFNPNPIYKNLDDQISTYLFQINQRGVGQPHVVNLTKTPTNEYPGDASPRPARNDAFRFAFGMTLMEDAFFVTHTNHVPDAWWDEYSVDVTPGSNNYGKAIAKNNISQVRQHRGWLGTPLGRHRRVYNDPQFAPSQSLVPNGTFDSNLNGWTGSKVTLARDTASTQDGAGSLRASAPSTYQGSFSGASIKGPKVNIVKDREYTLAFSARADKIREIRANAGGGAEKFMIGPKWRRYALTFKAGNTASKPVTFDVGKEMSRVWVDSVYFFEGNANVFRRDFSNGIVVANATHSLKTVDLNGTFQLIDGTQDSVNSGLQVTSVTLRPFDARLLVRLDGQQGGGGSGGGGGGGGAGTGQIGDYVWNDANGDGIQGSGESGVSGVTVRLQDCNGNNLASTTTDASGAYLFSSLDAGSYQVKFVQPSGFNFSPAEQGTQSGQNSDPDPTTGVTPCRTLSDGQLRLGVDAGLIPTGGGGGGGTGTGQIGDYVWNDANGNGIQGAGESGVSGVTVRLQECNGTNLASTTTDANGNYLFDAVEPGSYQVKFVLPSGFTFSPANQGTQSGQNSDPDANGVTPCRALSDGQWRLGIDAGLVPTGGGGGGGNVDVCGQPGNYNTRPGLFVWQNCSTGQWHVRAAGGGAATAQEFDGRVVSDRPMTNISNFELDPVDSVTRELNDKRIRFDLFVIDFGEDGFSFQAAGAALKLCLKLPVGGPVFLGKDGAQMTAPVNLLDPGAACP